GWRRICSPDLLLSPYPAGTTTVSAGGRVFKNRILGSASELVLGVQMRSLPRRAFCAGAFLMDFLAGYPVLPIQRSILSRPHPLPAPWLPTPSERNVTNASENIVRMKRGKIVTHYRSAPIARARPYSSATTPRTLSSRIPAPGAARLTRAALHPSARSSVPRPPCGKLD